MGGLKRKSASAGEQPVKSTKTATDESRPSKRSKAVEEQDQPKTITSRLKEEEPLFPRGGGSILSPLEQKQIQIQAKQDALFEQEDEAAAAAGSTKKAKGKRRPSAAATPKGVEKPPRDENAVRIESLKFNQLVKGTLVLAQVSEINDYDLVLALPNRLFGYVPITAVSQILNKSLESAMRDDDKDDDDESDDDDDDEELALGVKKLSSLFQIGQYVRASVVSTMDAAQSARGKDRKRIELSLLPEHTNSGLKKTDLVENCTVMATVESVEDRGYVMNISLPGSDTRGFLPKKEVDPSTPEERMAVGVTLLCTVARGKGQKGKTIQLSTLPQKLKASDHTPSEATTINTFLPGTAAEVLVSEITSRGFAGKMMGHLDVTADIVHSGVGPLSTDLEAKYKIGSKVTARIICTFPSAATPKLGVSILPQVLSLQNMTTKENGKEKLPLDVLPHSSFVEKCIVRSVQPSFGVFVDVGIEGVPGFVPISRLSDAKVDTLFESSGPYQVGSVHRGRILGYSTFDGIFSVSFEQSVLDEPYLRIDDIAIGEVLRGTIEHILVKEEGVSGVIVRVSSHISGLVPATHLSDVHLKNPETKFREGTKVKARVLSRDTAKGQLRLTLKKTLVNSDAPLIKSFDELSVGMKGLGTIIRIYKSGALVQFYNSLVGFLPINEMSEAYIRDPEEHFRVGQVVTVHIVSLDTENRKLVVSCKDPSAFGMEKKLALQNLKLGDIVSAKVTEKTDNDVSVELTESLLKATLPSGHMTDKSLNKEASALKRTYVGQTLSELVVIGKNDSHQSIIVSHKPSLVKAAKQNTLPADIEHVKVGDIAHGFVRNITTTAVFVQFAGGLTALLPRSTMDVPTQQQTDYGMHKMQSIEVRITSVDKLNKRLVVALTSVDASAEKAKPSRAKLTADDERIGKIVKAQIISNNGTQLNVRIEDDVQGRIDVSQVYDTWEEIVDPKYPLKEFRLKQIIRARVVGVHQARAYNSLVISHRVTHAVLDLSIRPSHVKEDAEVAPLTIGQVKPGSSWLAFVNNVNSQHIWVSISPVIRGRIDAAEASDSLLERHNLIKSFPLGSAMRVRVLEVSPEGKLILSARSSKSKETVNPTWNTIKQGTIVPARVTKVEDNQIMVNLGQEVFGRVRLPDFSDDFSKANPLKYSKDDIIQVCLVEVDKDKRRLRLSTRPSRVLDSTLAVQDREVTKDTKLEPMEIIRGFVKNTSDKGVFIDLGGDVTGFVQLKDLSDRYLKEWREHFHIGQLVKGRLISVDRAIGHIQMSLRRSAVDENYVAPKTLSDFKVGEVVTGKVRKVEDFGAFILLDNSHSVSGLCHRSEMAEKNVADPKKLYQEGDVVKARILKVDVDKKRISLGLKPSYFVEEDSDMDVDDEDEGGALVFSDEDSEEEEDDDEMLDVQDILITGTDNVAQSDSDDAEDDAGMPDAPAASRGLEAGGFDWSGGALDVADGVPEPGTGDGGDTELKTAKKRRRAEIQIDRTGELDAHGPQTASDYERLLLGQPDSAPLWIAYMAFQMQVSELSKAREIAERAIKTINIREEEEKLNVWIAYLNLEVAYGTEEAVEAVFKRACEYNDEQKVHERLSSIYIQSGKHDKADELFQALLKKFGSKSPEVWENYAHFLYVTAASPDRARALLPRALRTLHDGGGSAAAITLRLTPRFAALEFRSAHGEPERGRTLFESVLATYPKRLDLWEQLLGLETSAYAAAKAEDPASADPAPVREVFDRALRARAVRPRRAMDLCRRWGEWERENGDDRSRARVSARAKEWVAEAEARKKKAAAGDAEEEGQEE